MERSHSVGEDETTEEEIQAGMPTKDEIHHEKEEELGEVVQLDTFVKSAEEEKKRDESRYAVNGQEKENKVIEQVQEEKQKTEDAAKKEEATEKKTDDLEIEGTDPTNNVSKEDEMKGTIAKQPMETKEMGSDYSVKESIHTENSQYDDDDGGDAPKTRRSKRTKIPSSKNKMYEGKSPEVIPKKKTLAKSQDEEIYEMACNCDQYYDETRPMLECDNCLKWIHGECVDRFLCPGCEEKSRCANQEEITKLKKKLTEVKAKEWNENEGEDTSQLKQLKAILKSKETIIRELQTTNKHQEKEIERLKKEEAKVNDEMEKLKSKTLKEMSNMTERLLENKESYQKDMEAKEIQHQEKVNNMTKEIEQKRREIDVHTRNIVELKKIQEKGCETRELQEADKDVAEEREADKCKIAGLEAQLITITKSWEEEKQKWSGERKASEIQSKKEINKLLMDVKQYEARIESLLEDGSKTEKLIQDLREETKVIKDINKSLEMEKESETGQGEKRKKGVRFEEENDNTNSDPSQEGENEKKKGKKCWYWMRKGNCKFGIDCMYDPPVVLNDH